MGEKILMIVIALLAGVAGGVGYRLTSDGPADSPGKMQSREMREIKGQLAAVQDEIKALGEMQQVKLSNPHAVAAKLENVEKQIVKLNERMAVEPVEPLEDRMSNRELFAEIKRFREEERAAIRDENIQQEPRIEEEKEDSTEAVNIENYEEQIIKGVAKLAFMLSLTPEQIHELRKVGDEFLEKLREAKRLAEENNDPAYAVRMSKELERGIVRRIGLEVLTPEQLDKWREKSDDIRRALPPNE
ncbi:MAG: hypothetical protein E3J72_21150 [Planctomycetota bacterium]|nr:MAG: hypothetical protein E3J72_21150 [Planctomycetota bacterium]